MTGQQLGLSSCSSYELSQTQMQVPVCAKNALWYTFPHCQHGGQYPAFLKGALLELLIKNIFFIVQNMKRKQTKALCKRQEANTTNISSDGKSTCRCTLCYAAIL